MLGKRRYICLGFVFFMLIICTSSIVYSDIIITEVMFDPSSCSDSNCEWVEIWNNASTTVNLTQWELDGKTIGSEENDVIILADSYIVFARELIDDSDSDEDSFESWQGNGDGVWEEGVDGNYLAYDLDISLSNSEDEVLLYNSDGELVDSFVYAEDEVENLEEDYSLELTLEGEIVESLAIFGSPGRINGRWSISEDYSQIIISEFMPDPDGEDDSLMPFGEWIELQNTGENVVDLSGLWIEDSASNKLYVSSTNSLVLPEEMSLNDFEENRLDISSFVSGTILEPEEFLVVFRNGQSSFSLNNAGFEEIFLYSLTQENSEEGEEEEETELIDSIDYSDSISNMAIALVDSQWIQTSGTPGFTNEYLGPCDWAIDLDFDEQSVFLGDDFEFEVLISRELGDIGVVSVTGEILDYYGDVVKSYVPWTNEEVSSSRSKRYSPNLAEGMYEARFEINSLDCSDIELSDNVASSFFAINPEYQLSENRLAIDTVYDAGSDNSFSWGEAFRVKVEVYKGDDTRTAIELYAEDSSGMVVSERSKLNVYENYQHYTLTLPIQLDPNCNEKYSDGKITLVLEGLGIEDNQGILVVGKDDETCQNYDDYLATLASNEINENELLFEEYKVEGLSSVYAPGETLFFDVVFSSDGEAHDYSVWSYVYNGPTCISCFNGETTRDSNAQELFVISGGKNTASFLLKLDDEISIGEYNLKVKIMKDERKTADELTIPLIVTSSGVTQGLALEKSSSGNKGVLTGALVSSASDIFVPSEYVDESVFERPGGIVVYQSTSQRAYKLVPYMMIISLSLVCFIVWKKV